MNYELAKQLKEAGYKGITLVEPDGFVGPLSLSELIDISRPFLWQTYDEKWCAGNPTGTWNERTIDVDFDDEVGCGSTPEEAVAMLWLALNKNKE